MTGRKLRTVAADQWPCITHYDFDVAVCNLQSRVKSGVLSQADCELAHNRGSESGRAYPYIICTRRELKNGVVAGCVRSDGMFIGSDWVFNIHDRAGDCRALHISYHSRNSTGGLSLSSDAEACRANQSY